MVFGSDTLGLFRDKSMTFLNQSCLANLSKLSLILNSVREGSLQKSSLRHYCKVQFLDVFNRAEAKKLSVLRVSVFSGCSAVQFIR